MTNQATGTLTLKLDWISIGAIASFALLLLALGNFTLLTLYVGYIEVAQWVTKFWF